MSRDTRLYLEDIVSACEKVGQYAKGQSRETFESNTLVYDAICRNLQIIGEAAKHVPADIRLKIPAQWREIAGLRDFLAHWYFGLDSTILWDSVENDVPALEGAVRAFLQSSEH